MCLYVFKHFILELIIPAFSDVLATFPDYSLQHILSVVVDYFVVGPNFLVRPLWVFVINEKNK